MQALGPLAAAQDHQFGEPDRGAGLGAGLAPHQRAVAGRHLALAMLRIVAEQIFGDNKAQDPVAQELQPLVVALVLLRRGMGKRPDQQNFVVEAVADPH